MNPSSLLTSHIMTIIITPSPRTIRSKPTKAILCIHGTGGSANIFRVQTSKLRMALRHDFEFVYATAPFESEPGPGILPLFRDMGPYYTWVKKANAQNTPTVSERLLAMQGSIQTAVQDWQGRNPHIPIVGMLAFSEGALVAALMMWEQQMGRLSWLPKMEVAMLICCYYTEEATEHMKADKKSTHDGVEEQPLIKVPTLHIQGLQDVGLEGSRKLAATHFFPQKGTVQEFQGGHHVPNRKGDVDEAARRFTNLYARQGLR